MIMLKVDIIVSVMPHAVDRYRYMALIQDQETDIPRIYRIARELTC